MTLAGVLDAIADLADGRIEAIHRDEADGGVLGAVAISSHIALAGVDGEFHADLGALVEVADHQIGVEDLHVVDDLNVARQNRAGTGLLQDHALGAIALHLDPDVLDVEDDVGHILAHAGDRGELMEHAVDLDGGDGRALKRGEEHAAQGVAQRLTKAALKRLGDHGGRTTAIVARKDLELVGTDEFLPVLLNHDCTFRLRGISVRRPWPRVSLQ